jgi:hypothetical protein
MSEKVKCIYCSRLFVDDSALQKHAKESHPKANATDEVLDDLARQSIRDFLLSDGQDKGLREKAKQANAYRSTEARREQTQSAREATIVMMARELAQDKQQFQQYLRAAMPNAAMVKALPRGNA